MARSFSEIVEGRIASGKTRLPIFEGTALRLRELLADPNVEIDALVAVISKDTTLASAMLRLSNSSFFGGLSEVRNVRDAVMRLGLQQVARLALLVTQGDAYRVRWEPLRPLVASLWAHAVAVSLGCEWLAGKIGRRDLASQAFMGGMLHDIGKLLVLRVVDDLRTQSTSFRPEPGLIRELLRSRHTRYGEALLRQWNIPEPYPRLVGRHHEPEVDEDDVLLLLVRLVDQTCNKLGLGLEPAPDAIPAASEEAQALRVSDLVLAELEVQLEDAGPAAEAARGTDAKAGVATAAG
jgi:HD-like signal output (HDOD) protein